MENGITLKEGLYNFQQKNAKVFTKKQLSIKGKEFLDCHDIAHVVFGCDTSIYGEGIVKIWTTFGTTLSFWKVVKGYNDASAFQLFKQYSFGHVSKNIFRLMSAIPKTIARARQMSKPWPFTDYEAYLDRPISEIREEFNIVIQ